MYQHSGPIIPFTMLSPSQKLKICLYNSFRKKWYSTIKTLNMKSELNQCYSKIQAWFLLSSYLFIMLVFLSANVVSLCSIEVDKVSTPWLCIYVQCVYMFNLKAQKSKIVLQDIRERSTFIVYFFGSLQSFLSSVYNTQECTENYAANFFYKF